MPTVPISITLPQELLEQVKVEVAKGEYASVSEFVRGAVRDKFGLMKHSKISDESRLPINKSDAKLPAEMVTSAHQSVSVSARSIGGSGEDSPWITGKVHRGQQLGGKLGFPTLNLDPLLLSNQVPYGVFAAEVEVDDRIYQSATHYGPRKTLDEWRPTLELHLLDFDRHIPGHLIRFRLLKRIRETMKFDSLEQLGQQLATDVAAVRRYFEGRSEV